MKRGILFGVLALIFLMSLSLITPQTNETCGEDCKVDKAYSCLEEKIDAKTCSQLSSGEKVFSLLAVGECKDAVLNDAEYKSDIKFTAQTILALKNLGTASEESESWLLSENKTTENINWYLQIDSTGATTCTIKYDSTTGTVNIGEDKKISGNLGTCLTLAQDNYWLRVSSLCYNKDFSVSCNQPFLTGLLYQKQGSPTIYVSEETHFASAGGTVIEKVRSLCFGKDSCDYEGSLWAALALDSSGKDVSSYLPYLITMADELANKKYFPEAFLYMLTDEFRTELLAKQKMVNNNYYWEESGDKFYDTALALYPFQDESPTEKTKSKEWLLEIQDENGCWNSGNIRNTAFILYSIWPKKMVGGDIVDCKDAEYHCMSSLSCKDAGGDILKGYSCSGVFVCCSKELIQETCAEQKGEICSSDETCKGGTKIDAPDVGIGEVCCLGGTCEKVKKEVSDCELAEGICRIYSCDKNETESDEDCESSSQVCCVKTTQERSYAGIIIFGVLILLVVLGIVFREKLKPLWFRIKSKFGKGKGKPGPGPRPPGGPPRFPPGPPPLGRIMPRRILPPQGQPLRRPISRPRESQGELSEVLKKLKEMGK